jgi:hypothetical protein
VPLRPKRPWRPPPRIPPSGEPPATPSPSDFSPRARVTRPYPERTAPDRAPAGLLREEPSSPEPRAPTTPAEQGVSTAYLVLERFLEEGRRYAEGQSAWYGDDPAGQPDLLRETVRGGADVVGFLSRLGRELSQLANTLQGSSSSSTSNDRPRSPNEPADPLPQPYRPPIEPQRNIVSDNGPTPPADTYDADDDDEPPTIGIMRGVMPQPTSAHLRAIAADLTPPDTADVLQSRRRL